MPTPTIPRLLLLSVLLLALTACADGTAVGAGGPADDDTATEAPIPVEPDGGIGDGAGPPGPLAEAPDFGVSSEADSLSATPFTSCWSTADTGVCADGFPTPLDHQLEANAQLVVTYEPGTVTAFAWPLDEADPAAEPADADRTELPVVEENPGVNLVDVSSEYWLDALFEQSWAYFMAGDYPHALGNIHTIQSPYFPRAFYPEADIVRMVIYFTICQYEDATSLVAKFQKKYEPLAKELEGVLKRYEGEGGEQGFYDFMVKVQAGESNLSPAIQPVVESALSDRQLLRHLEYVKVLDTELKRFTGAPSSFKNSPVGADVEDNIGIAKTDAIRRTGILARKRYKRMLDELREHLRSSQKIIVDITNAQRKKIDETIATGQWSAEDAYEFGRVDPDEEHILWPFDGEYWRDELGYYRQVVASNGGAK